MLIKIAVFIFVILTCHASQPENAEFDSNPRYSYAYSIHDTLTGDFKGQTESRNGDVVQGSYSLVDPDGIRRTVQYTADPVKGFNAVIYREPAVVTAPITSYSASAAATPSTAAPITSAIPSGDGAATAGVPVFRTVLSPEVVSSGREDNVPVVGYNTEAAAVPEIRSAEVSPVYKTVGAPIESIPFIGYQAAAAAVSTPIFRDAPITAKPFWLSFTTPDFSYSIE